MLVVSVAVLPLMPPSEQDVQLVYRIVRAHWERPRFEAIKGAYQAKYRICMYRASAQDVWLMSGF